MSFSSRKESSFANLDTEHTLLVTETGVEVLTARTADSPGGAIPMPDSEVGKAGDAAVTGGDNPKPAAKA